ncbi:MAG: hypothetical protein V3U76_19095 [Granulosicoccus sp.]
MKTNDIDDMRPDYSDKNLSNGVRGKHYAAYQKSKNLVLLSPDVAAAFPTEESVNEALRNLINDQEKNANPDCQDVEP